jgi:hypothetical protein
MAMASINETEVRNWLTSIKLPQYADAFLANGFDDLEVSRHRCRLHSRRRALRTEIEDRSDKKKKRFFIFPPLLMHSQTGVGAFDRV